MTILDFYESGEHKSNIAHFAAIVSLATIDGVINNEENKVLKRLAFKLDLSKEEYEPVLKNPNNYPLIPPYSLEKRIERIHDLFNTIYADYKIDDAERGLFLKYAVGLGFSEDEAHKEIEKCIRIYSGKEEFED
ncbi:MAG: TerB family tellurite resistance protein [Maribacter sp.]